ncbi:MAG: caspase family protein [Gammaproteobacteria bacterium]|nr:caspase family protein [Gammaproteobacteria bacterium]
MYRILLLMKQSLLQQFTQIILSVILLLSLQPSWSATERVALVIGNSAYKDSPLKNPSNDARDMAAKLRKLGFEVEQLINANKRSMKEAIRRFGKKLHQKDTVGLFYFAGHGVQLDGSNYLLPIKAKIESEADIEFEAVNAARVLQQMEQAENNLNLVILDACRNNPFTSSFRSASRGLTKMNAPNGSMILYATSPGNVAADGEGSNGLFTEKLLKMMDEKGLKIEEVFKKTAIAVNQASGKKQSPYIEGFILGDFYFNDSNVTIQQAPEQVTTADPDMASKAENRFWDSVETDPSIDMYQEYLKAYPKGHYAGIAKIKLKKLKHKASPKPVPQVITGKLTIRSNVNDDTVRLNGENKGSSRLDLNLKAGIYALEVSKKGYDTWERNLEVKVGREQTVYAKLKRITTSIPKPDNTNIISTTSNWKGSAIDETCGGVSSNLTLSSDKTGYLSGKGSDSEGEKYIIYGAVKSSGMSLTANGDDNGRISLSCNLNTNGTICSGTWFGSWPDNINCRGTFQLNAQ